MIDSAPSLDVGQSFKRLEMASFFFIEPRRQRLFHDPRARPIEAFDGGIDLLGQRQGNVRSEDPGCHRISNHIDWK